MWNTATACCSLVVVQSSETGRWRKHSCNHVAMRSRALEMFLVWLAVRACVSDWWNSAGLIAVCSQHMVSNELSHSTPSLRLSQDFPPVWRGHSGRMVGGYMQQPCWPSLVAWWCFHFFLIAPVIFYFNLISDPAKARVQDICCCLSMQCFHVLIKGHAFLYTHTSAGKKITQISKILQASLLFSVILYICKNPDAAAVTR